MSKFKPNLEKIRSNDLKQCSQNKKVQLAFRQPKILQKILTKAKFEENPIPPTVKEVGLFLCNDCIDHRCGYFKEIFSIKSNQ